GALKRQRGFVVYEPVEVLVAEHPLDALDGVGVKGSSVIDAGEELNVVVGVELGLRRACADEPRAALVEKDVRIPVSGEVEDRIVALIGRGTAGGREAVGRGVRAEFMSAHRQLAGAIQAMVGIKVSPSGGTRGGEAPTLPVLSWSPSE